MAYGVPLAKLSEKKTKYKFLLPKAGSPNYYNCQQKKAVNQISAKVCRVQITLFNLTECLGIT